MTREEAIEMLKSKLDGHTDTSYEWTETVRMAVQALEQTNGVIAELGKIKEEIQGLIDFEESCCGNTTLGYQCLGVIKDKISELKGESEVKEYKAEVITRGNCMICGKELTEGLFLCKECGEKANKKAKMKN